MRILLLTLGMTLFSVVADIYIYRRVIRRRCRKGGKRAYIIGCLVIDVAIVGALLLFRYGPIDTPTLVVMWIVALFFAHVVPGLVYMIFSLPGIFVGRRFFHRLGAVLGLAVLATMVWGVTFGRSSIRVEQVEIVSDQLPEAFDGLRVVQFSDLHLGTLIGERRFVSRLVGRINELQPDIVIQSGDIVNMNADELNDRAMQQLMQIEARYGVFAAIGNHDLGFYMPDDSPITPAESLEQLIEKQCNMGWHLLVNQTEWLHEGADSIAITGLGFMARDPSPQHQLGDYTAAEMGVYGALNEQSYNITIAHTPNQWGEIRATGKADLTLSGHTHAMQMKLFGWSPAAWMYRWYSGLYPRGPYGPELYIHNEQWLYVNDGLGCVMYPMRINVRPEITLFILHRP